jgi:signal transduction histidine kinase
MAVLGLRSLRNRLIAIFVAVVATAMGVVFLYVVPSLQDRLIDERLGRLAAEATDPAVRNPLRAALADADYERAEPILVRLGRRANAQVSLFARSGDVVLPVNIPSRAEVSPEDPTVMTAATTGEVARGRADGGAVVVAVPFERGVVALSQGVGDVDRAAALVERRIVIAGALAVVVASMVGWGAALGISRRVQRLERAARRISVGEFDRPIGDESPDELGQLARAFDLMQNRLAQIDRARKDFIANASHELRTPLFSLGGFLELLGDEDLDEETRQEFLRTMREQVTRLAKLATDLLDLSRLDAGGVELEREAIDLTASARALVREFRGLAARHGSRLVLARPPAGVPAGIGDEQRVQQIGRALVDNAIRHNPPGTDVRIAVTAADGRVALAVSDDGPGISPDARAHLFERFYRGSDATAGGSGLGLAIAWELAQRMGGTLEAESDDDGTRFTLGLPAAAAPDAVGEPVAAS